MADKWTDFCATWVKIVTTCAAYTYSSCDEVGCWCSDSDDEDKDENSNRYSMIDVCMKLYNKNYHLPLYNQGIGELQIVLKDQDNSNYYYVDTLLHEAHRCLKRYNSNIYFMYQNQ